MFRGRARHLHLVGIGGSGMSGIAEVLHTLGFSVTGSDLADSNATARLRSLGVGVKVGHDPAHQLGADVVVVSSAIGADNPEVVAAHARGVPVVPRAEMLAELMRLRYGIAVAGTHGKTTTCSLIAAALEHGGIDPTTVIGGRLRSAASHGRLGAGEYLVAEADESDGSFLRLSPTIAVVTNIDADHLDHWQGGLPQIEAAFAQFVGRLPFYGAAVLCIEHPGVQRLLASIQRRKVTYGFGPQADWRAQNVSVLPDGTAFDVCERGRVHQRVQVRLFGHHNVLNALAAFAVANEVGVPVATTAQALAAFGGIARRFEVKGEAASILVVDDYGHHPAEITATLAAAADAFGRRLVVAFQPHRYSRTHALGEQFASCFQRCDTLLMLDIYAAGEAPIPQVTSQRLAAQVTALGHRDCRWVGGLDDCLPAVLAQLRADDVLLTMGAGSITRLGDRVLAALATRH